MNKLIERLAVARFWIAWIVMPAFARRALVRLADRYEATQETPHAGR